MQLSSLYKYYYLYPTAHYQLIQEAFTEIINITICMYTQNTYIFCPKHSEDLYKLNFNKLQ